MGGRETEKSRTLLRGQEQPEVILWIMSNAYRFVLECPNGHDINSQRKCAKESLSDIEALEMFGDVEVSCQKINCGWRGKASETRLLQVVPFNWVLSPIT
jgi:hypothetical protein